MGSRRNRRVGERLAAPVAEAETARPRVVGRRDVEGPEHGMVDEPLDRRAEPAHRHHGQRARLEQTMPLLTPADVEGWPHRATVAESVHAAIEDIEPAALDPR